MRPRNFVAAVVSCMCLCTNALAQTVAPAQTSPPEKQSTPQPAIQAPQGPIVLRIDQAPELRVHYSTPPSGWTAKDVLPSIVGILTSIVAIISISLNYRTTKQTLAQKESEIQRSITRQANENELKSLKSKLEEFYGPYTLLSNTNAFLAREFISRQPNATGFRTLPLLLNPVRRETLSSEDKELLNEIVAINEQLERLIREKAGMVDQKVQEYLGRAAAHFRVIRLAHAGKLSSDPNGNFSKYYVYPWQLDHVLRLEVARIQNRCDILRQDSATHHPPLAPLDIPAKYALDPWPDPRAQ
jgi:hypothetical protein